MNEEEMMREGLKKIAEDMTFGSWRMTSHTINLQMSEARKAFKNMPRFMQEAFLLNNKRHRGMLQAEPRLLTSFCSDKTYAHLGVFSFEEEVLSPEKILLITRFVSLFCESMGVDKVRIKVQGGVCQIWCTLLHLHDWDPQFFCQWFNCGYMEPPK